VKAAGIAPAFRLAQVDTPHNVCVNTPPPCLHTACTNLALRKLVACWHRLTPHVRDEIVTIFRRHQDSSRGGE
jgi:hypothetical protein